MLKTEIQNLAKINFDALKENIELKKNQNSVELILKERKDDIDYFNSRFKEA